MTTERKRLAWLLVTVHLIALLFMPLSAEAQNYYGNPDISGALEVAKMRAQRAALERKTKKLKMLHFAAPFMGIVLMGGMALLARKLKKHQGAESKRGSREAARAKAFAAALSGKASPEELGRSIFNAVRFGNFTEYAALFPTQFETQQILTPEKNKAYWEGPRAPKQLRLVFEALREACFHGQGELKHVVIGGQNIVKTADGKSYPAISGNQLVLAGTEGQSKQVPFGSMIQLAVGWKLFMPKKPGEITIA